MSLRIAHFLAYECEHGCLILLCDTHNERDDRLDEAEQEWKRLGGEGHAPCFSLDILVSEDATPDDVRRRVMHFMRKQSLKNSLLKVLADVMALDMLEEYVDELLGHELPKNPPKNDRPTMH